jgi:hypothetical protein
MWKRVGYEFIVGRVSNGHNSIMVTFMRCTAFSLIQSLSRPSSSLANSISLETCIKWNFVVTVTGVFFVESFLQLILETVALWQ